MSPLELFRPDLVDVGLAKLDLVHSLQDPSTILREHVRSQPILRIVRVVNGLVETVHFENGHDGPKDFVLNKGRFLFDILYDCRFEEPALIWRLRPVAADDYLVSFLSRLPNEAHACLSLLLADHRPKVCVRLEGIADFQILGHADECRNKLVLDLLVHVHSFRADTCLATIPEPGPDGTLYRPGNIRIVPDDERGLTTELKDKLGKMIRSMLHDCSPSVSTAGHRNQTGDPVRYQLIANI